MTAARSELATVARMSAAAAKSLHLRSVLRGSTERGLFQSSKHRARMAEPQRRGHCWSGGRALVM